MNFLSTTFFPHIPLGFQTYLDVYIGAEDKSLTDSLIGPVDKIDPAVEKKMEKNETIIRTIISSYCRSRNFQRRIFSQIWLKQTFREFLFSSLCKGSCNLYRVDHLSKPINVPNQPFSAHFRHEKSKINGAKTHFFHLTSQE